MDCENSGWGNTSQGGTNNPDELQVVVIPIIGQDECNQLWDNRLNDGNICAGGKNKGPCNVRQLILKVNYLMHRKNEYLTTYFYHFNLILTRVS